LTCGDEIAASLNPQTLSSSDQQSYTDNGSMDCYLLIFKEPHSYYPLQVEIEELIIPEGINGYFEVGVMLTLRFGWSFQQSQPNSCNLVE